MDTRRWRSKIVVRVIEKALIKKGMTMSDTNNLIRINATVEITIKSLQTIVENAKKKVGKDNRGIYRVDTADKVSEMISKFLQENDFETYVMDLNHYD